MRQAVSLLLLSALLAPSFPVPLIAQEIGSSTPELSEEVASSTLPAEEASVPAIVSSPEAKPVIEALELPVPMTVRMAEAPPALAENEQFLINQPDASGDIVLRGAGGGADVYIQPAPVYTATASGDISSVRMYLARNSVVGFGQTIRLELYNPSTNQLICSLVYADSNPSSRYHDNYAPIPVGDAADVALVEFRNLLLFPDKPSCAITEGVSYEIRLINIVVVDPRFEEGILYTKGANATNEFFLQVIGEKPPPPPEPTPPPIVPGTILAKSTDAAWDRNGWTTGFAYNISFQDAITQEGVVTHIVMPLLFNYDAADAPLFFQLRDGFGGLYDCKTAVKTLTEWGIYNDARTNGAQYNTVTIGPFAGTECDTTLRITQNRGQTIGLNVYTTDPTTYQNVGGNLAVAGHVASDGTTEIPFIVYSATSTPPACASECYSSVLFLPGIKGSRLYSNDELLWEPDSNDDMFQLFLGPDGKSIRTDIVTKKHDVLGSAFGVIDVYDAYLRDLATLYDERKIKGYEAIAYDWRLSLDDIVNKGAEVEGNISYSTSTSTPYIEQTLRRLAADSHTDKVTIVAHSNGGLVTKALLQRLGEAETARLVDKIIFVGVPQTGAPHAIASALYGYKEAIPPIVSAPTAREVAENSPTTYHLMPSAQYFSDVPDPDHPIVKFSGVNNYRAEQISYGNTIESNSELQDFLLARDGGRTKPLSSDISKANVLNPTLTAYGASTHAIIDTWVPPAEVKVTQIAGWGLDTIAGVEFYEACPFTFCGATYRPIFVEDGDGVVPVPSALMMSTTTANVERYWADLNSLRRNHGDLLQSSEVIKFIENKIKNNHTLYSSIYSVQPESSNDRKLRFFLHSPLTLELYDEEGNHLGFNSNGSFDEEIEDAEYGEFGEVKYLSVPAGKEYRVVMRGQDTGTFSFDLQETQGNEVVESSTLANMPVTPSTVASLSITDGVETASALDIDTEGDGEVDISLVPKTGETVVYVPDTKPPEAVLTLDVMARALEIATADDASATTTPVALGTSTFSRLTDSAGNTLQLSYLKNEQRQNSAQLWLSGIKYGATATTSASAVMRYYWVPGAKSSSAPLLLLAHIKTADSAVLALYIHATKKTVIMSATAKDDTADLATLAATLTLKPRATVKKHNGMVIPYVFTQKEKVRIGY